MAGDNIDSTTFTISSQSGADLSLDLLAGEQILIRATSVGENRTGSSKIVCEVPDDTLPPPPPPEDDFSFEKELDTSVEFDLSSDTDITLEKDVDSDVDLDGNFASATFSSERSVRTPSQRPMCTCWRSRASSPRWMDH